MFIPMLSVGNHRDHHVHLNVISWVMGWSVFPAALPALFGELWACLLRSSSPSSSKASYTIYHQGTSDCMTSLVLIYRQGLSSLKWLARAITQILWQTFVTAYLDDLCIYHWFFYLRRVHSNVLAGRLIGQLPKFCRRPLSPARLVSKTVVGAKIDLVSFLGLNFKDFGN